MTRHQHNHEQGSRSAKLAVALALAAPLLFPAAAAQAVEVGVAAAVNRDAFGTAPGASRSTKVLGDNVIYRERIETSGDGLVQVLLVDGSTFTVGANSDLVIDEFVYDPNAGSGKLVVSFGKGVARFVGGKLSKNKGGVTVKTPVGTIGIRGGIANLNMEGGSPTFSLLFGEELTFTGNGGGTRRIFENGYTLQIGPSGLPTVRRTTQSDLGSVQKGLTSRGGQSGGAARKPTDNSVANSGVPNANSNLGAVNTTPPPKPPLVQTTNPENIDQTLVQPNKVTQTTTSEDLGNQQTETSNVRVLRAGSTFSPTYDQALIVSNPGDQGLIGGTAGTDITVVFSEGVSNDPNYRLWHGDVGSDTIYVFESGTPTAEYYSQSITDEGYIVENADTNEVPSTPVITDPSLGNLVDNASGFRVIGENFAFVTHFPATYPGTTPTYNYGGMDVLYGLYGTATDFSSFGNSSEGTAVRQYALGGDALTAFQMGSAGTGGSFVPLGSSAIMVNPLIAADMGATFMGAVSSTGLKMIESSPTSLLGAKFLASSFHIDGNGASQKSLVSLALGTVFDEGEGPQMDFGRRGSHRRAASESAGLYGGAVGTLRGADGGHFFGPNANNFVLFPDMENDDPFGDGYVNRPSDISNTDTLSGTAHVGVLTGETAVSSLTRSSRSLQGYGAAMFESTSTYSGSGPVAFSSNMVGDVTFEANAADNDLYTTIKVKDVNADDTTVDSYTVAMGTRPSDGNGKSRSAYIDDNTYAARDARDRADTFLETDGGALVGGGGGSQEVSPTTGVVVPHRSDNNPNSYLVPNTLVADADNTLFSGKTECTCAFLEWGYWGTALNFDDSTNLPEGQRYDTAHLGTWVAGNVTNSASLPITGSANYAGHAVGNVVNAGSQYLAAGNFNMNMDFGNRTATASVTNFDGRNFSANLNEQTVASGNMFSGTVSSMSGVMNTSIVGGPNSDFDGVIGNFNVQDGTWAATGIVAGELQ
jgi:hypothetical protein